MSTNLLLGYPGIPFSGTAVSTTYDYETGVTQEDIASGDRQKIVRLAAVHANCSYVWSTTTSTSDFIYIARADLLKTNGCTTAQVLNSPDGSSWTSLWSNASFSSVTLIGPRLEDYIATWATSTSRTYYGVYLAATGNSKFDFAKIYLGKLFDLGRDPMYGASQVRKAIVIGNRAAPITFSLNWKGITDATRVSFNDTIGKYADVSPVALYDSGNVLLNGWTCLHAWITSFKFTPVAKNVNNLDIEFQEVI